MTRSTHGRSDGAPGVTVRPVRSAADHRAVLAEIETLMHAGMHAGPGTPEGDRLDVLATLVEAWEARRVPIENTTV
jgi:HTH-type transcriptional regulator/antitoxin HigA